MLYPDSGLLAPPRHAPSGGLAGLQVRGDPHGRRIREIFRFGFRKPGGRASY
jgi:hypothetical protein